MTSANVLQKRQIFAIALLALPYYFMFMTDFGTRFGRPGDPLNIVFNSMLDYLLQGRFDIDPKIVGMEGFTRNGKVISYWGVFPALLRLPLVMFDNWKNIDVTPWSCLAATVFALVAKLWTVRIIAMANPRIPLWLVIAASVALVFSGAQISYMRSSVYQEVCLWSGFFGAVFVAGAVQGVVSGRFSERVLSLMAFAAGMALLTRVSVAVGLYAAIGLLLTVILFRALQSRRLEWRTILPATIILLFFLVITGIINFGRWGNPLTFADYSLYNYNADFPDRLPRTIKYGLFNLERVPFGLMYFFAPIWFLLNDAGQLIFETTRIRLIDQIELPPSSFLLTDTILLGLMGVGVWSGVSRLRAAWSANLEKIAIGVGLFASPVLMLTAISMNYRYRIDFYPFFEFGAFVGLIALVQHFRFDRPFWRRAVWTMVAVSIAGSHVSMALYRLSDLGPAYRHLGHGIVKYYYDQIDPPADT